MAARAGVFLIILFLAKPVERTHKVRWIIWNVGQGQWITRIDHSGCWHFDMGGERSPWGAVMKLCRSARNRVHLSHWDSDHMNFAGKALFFLPNICAGPLPPFAAGGWKQRLLSRLTRCPELLTPLKAWRPESAASSNDGSVVISWREMLIPGDSSQRMEKIWMDRITGLGQTKILVLGHHGSRTSTSLALLARLKGVRTAIASARKRRYGHPHAETQTRLRRLQIPLLTTEDWGHIHIWL